MLKKTRIISGIQPSGKLHIGNYAGAIKNFLKFQNNKKFECLFFIADLHSLTQNFNPKEKNKEIKELILDFQALGLDFKKSIIFIQSSIPQHCELMWLLNNITPLGELKRMTQFKDKSEKQPENINAGLLNYPILMAADILLYDAKYVPVGEDQIQHLELTREIARKFNKLFGKTFIEPKPILTISSRIMNLNNPSKKMSKSEPEGCLFLEDKPEIIKNKILKAITDSESKIKYDPLQKPGISNLILIYQTFSDLSIKQIENKFKNKNYFEFKKELINLLIEKLENFQKTKKRLKTKEKEIYSKLKENNEKAFKIAINKIKEVKTKIGLLV